MTATKRKTTWLCCYSVWRQYGGREEGGWWYDMGKFLGAYLVPTDNLDAEIDKLQATQGWSSRYNRYSALGGSDFEIVICDHDQRVGKHYTTERMRYE